MARSIGWIAWCAFAVTTAIAACGGGSTGDAPGSSGGPGSDGGATSSGGPAVDGAPAADGASGGALPCAVDTVLSAHCRQCHAATPQFGAPMPLMTWSDLHAPAVSDPTKRVYELVGVRIHDDAKPMPQPPNPRLSAGDTSTLDAWIAQGAPTGDACSAPPPPPPDASVPPLSCTPDETLSPTSPWTMPTDTNDVYVCYGVDVTRATKRHVIAMTPKIGNTKIVHHLLLFQADQSFGATPQPCSGGGSLNWRIVYGWAPGGLPIELPQEAGFPEEGTTHYVVQVHYNNVNHLAGETDSSGFDLCTTDQLRPNDADVMAFGTQKISIPPRATVDTTCSVTVPSSMAGLHMFAAMPHMHKLGTTIGTVDSPAGGGADVDFGTRPAFDFQAQSWLPIDGVTKAGDVIKTRCVWNNTTDQTVTFGENTENEMCYSFTMYYPRITSGVWSWALPAGTSTCK